MHSAFDAEAARLGYPPEARATLVACGARLTGGNRAALVDRDCAPTALLTGNDAIAAGLYADLAALGRPVGEATAVISATTALDPFSFAPALTSFDTDLDAVGCALAAHLIAALPGVEGRAAPVSGIAPMQFAARGSHLVDGATAPRRPETVVCGAKSAGPGRCDEASSGKDPRTTGRSARARKPGGNEECLAWRM